MSADQGDVDAQVNHGLILVQGDGIAVNKSLAVHYLEMSANQGQTHAQIVLGQMLFRGDGIEVNKSRAARYFKMSADQGNRDPQYDFDLSLLHGDGIPVNKSLAAHHLKMSADHDHVLAQFMFGQILCYGEGIQMNKSLGARYLKISIYSCDTAAQRNYHLFIAQNVELSADRKKQLDKNESVDCHFSCRESLCLATVQRSTSAEIRLTLFIFSGVFGRFDIPHAQYHFEHLSKRNEFARLLCDSFTCSELILIRGDDFCVERNVFFSILRDSLNEELGLIWVLNDDNDMDHTVLNPR
jgi:hypothetical protein